ncbi:hypothetical protein BSU04_16315 [Caballeronia sordidicola]|uniref:Uncharacterized protein n=1 Tax=Caballeronia sordidicola TaxID=196367 RepID=A0A226X3N7_CABSO|nr:hypothetical protein BSU04_16315 [Caballeronia sordidicola]
MARSLVQSNRWSLLSGGNAEHLAKTVAWITLTNTSME